MIHTWQDPRLNFSLFQKALQKLDFSAEIFVLKPRSLLNPQWVPQTKAGRCSGNQPRGGRHRRGRNTSLGTSTPAWTAQQTSHSMSCNFTLKNSPFYRQSHTPNLPPGMVPAGLDPCPQSLDNTKFLGLFCSLKTSGFFYKTLPNLLGSSHPAGPESITPELGAATAPQQCSVPKIQSSATIWALPFTPCRWSITQGCPRATLC